MSKELAIVDTVIKTGKGVEALEGLIDKLPSIPTADLVTGFRIANGYSKKVSTFVDAVKKELVDNATQTGRFIKEGTPDAKGHLYLDGADGLQLKAEKRVSTKFDPAKARVLLEKEGLLDLGCERRVTCTSPERVLDLLLTVLDGKEDAEMQSAFLVQAVHLFEFEDVVTEARVEALVALEKIAVKDVEALMDTSIQYAVKEVKAKK